MWVWPGNVTEGARCDWLADGRSNVRVFNEVKVVGKLSRTLPVAPFADFHIPGSMGGGGGGGGDEHERKEGRGVKKKEGRSGREGEGMEWT